MRWECRERFPRHRGLAIHGTCVTHVHWCMPGSLTNGFLWSRWRGNRSRHFRPMRNPQVHVSGKRHVTQKPFSMAGGVTVLWMTDDVIVLWVAGDVTVLWVVDDVTILWVADNVTVPWKADEVTVLCVMDDITVLWVADNVTVLWVADDVTVL